MLLFIAKRHIGLELSEQAHLAVQAGCGWIQVCIDDIPDQDARAQLSVIANECREQGVILTIEDNPELAAEMGVHGVYISESSTNARALRENLEPRPSSVLLRHRHHLSVLWPPLILIMLPYRQTRA